MSITIIIGIAIFTIFTNNNENISKNTSSKRMIAVSSYNLYEFTKAIVNDKANVELIIPQGVEIHDWEPTVRDLERLNSYDILIYNSNTLELYINNIRENTDLILIEAAKGLTINNDPHIWLDPLLAKEELNNILIALTRIDKDNEDYYRKNAMEYSKRLDDLDIAFKEGLANCKREFIVLHNAYSYLANRYNLTQIALIKNPEDEPSANDIKEIIDLIRTKDIKVIYAERGIDPKIMQQLSEDTNTQILYLDPMEIISNENTTYIDTMLSNLQSLKEGLCK
jgi:zinc transport system substrate-binding protein